MCAAVPRPVHYAGPLEFTLVTVGLSKRILHSRKQSLQTMEVRASFVIAPCGPCTWLLRAADAQSKAVPRASKQRGASVTGTTGCLVRRIRRGAAAARRGTLPEPARQPLLTTPLQWQSLPCQSRFAQRISLRVFLHQPMNT
jgi:hypothetical protein